MVQMVKYNFSVEDTKTYYQLYGCDEQIFKAVNLWRIMALKPIQCTVTVKPCAKLGNDLNVIVKQV